MKLIPNRSYVWLTALVAVAAMIGCASRYRLDLHVTADGEMRRVKVEQTQFAPGTVLSDPMSETQLEPGEANCFVVTAGARGRTQSPSGKYDVLRYDEHLQYRLLLQMPVELTTGSWPLAERSFVQIMGRYELRKEEKLFTQSSGTIGIDSVSGNRAYLSIEGEFKNQSGATLAVKGKFRVKVK